MAAAYRLQVGLSFRFSYVDNTLCFGYQQFEAILFTILHNLVYNFTQSCLQFYTVLHSIT
jgi:hypothetical protein